MPQRQAGSLGNDEAVENGKATLCDMLVPVIILIMSCILGMLYVGGFFGGEASGDLIAAFGNTDAFVALPRGSLIALVPSFIYLLARRVITLKES